MTLVLLGSLVVIAAVIAAIGYAYHQAHEGGDDAEMFSWILKALVLVVLGVVLVSIVMVGIAVIERL